MGNHPMIKRSEVQLKIEAFADDEAERFLVRSRKEIQFTLHAIAEKGLRVALYYDDGNSFILTTALAADAQGLWLESGPKPTDNRRLAQSKHIVFVSSYHQIKIQFESRQAEMVMYQNAPAFYLPLPDTLLRIQRRDYYRLATHLLKPLKCTIPIKPGLPAHKREMNIMDISSGGIALVCQAEDTALQPGKVYPNCRIHLSGDLSISVTLEVRNSFVISKPSGETFRRVGCQFFRLDGKTEIVLQRYITQQQQDVLQSMALTTP
ncbi:MAG: hypothetical protein GC139_07295 [Sideroxydans sp.]|nr:hypothetical protein [Sideroxydans sp.]